MITRTHQKIATALPLLGFGVMRLPTNEDKTINRELAEPLLEAAYKSGIRYFDTAYGYLDGHSAPFLGEVLSKYPRYTYCLANKMPMWSVKEKEDVRKIFAKQIADLRTDYIDFYLLHALNTENWQKAKDFGAHEFLKSKKSEGVIRKYGFSFHGSLESLNQILDEDDWDFVQLQLNYLDWYSGNAKAEYEAVVSRGIPVIVMEPVRGGALSLEKIPKDAAGLLHTSDTSDEAAAFALKFAASLDGVITVLSGMSNQKQLEENIATFTHEVKFTAEDTKKAMNIVKIIKEGKFIACTDCKYCTEGCPMSITIPSIFTNYNLGREITSEIKSMIDSCLECGICADRCPQSLEIPTLLKELKI